MKVKHGEVILEAWQISKETPSDDWVKIAFENKKIWWTDELGDDKLAVKQWLGPAYGEIEDYLIFDQKSYSVVPKKRFSKDYEAC